MEKKYSLKQTIARGVTITGLAAIALTAPGCSTLGNFVRSQAEPYVPYSKEGIIDEKTGEIKFVLPYWQTKPVPSTLKVAAHALIVSGIAYGINQYNKSQQTTPVNDDSIIEDDPIVDDPVEDDPVDEEGGN